MAMEPFLWGVGKLKWDDTTGLYFCTDAGEVNKLAFHPDSMSLRDNFQYNGATFLKKGMVYVRGPCTCSGDFILTLMGEIIYSHPYQAPQNCKDFEHGHDALGSL